jgi:hypothetical protein
MDRATAHAFARGRGLKDTTHRAHRLGRGRDALARRFDEVQDL